MLKFNVAYNTATDYVKATTAAVVAGLGSLGVSLNEGGVTAQEWVAIASVTVVAFATGLGLYSNKDEYEPGRTP